MHPTKYLNALSKRDCFLIVCLHNLFLCLLFRNLGIYENKDMFNYRNSAKSDHPPHVFAMANNAYHAMIHEKRNQVKIL